MRNLKREAILAGLLTIILSLLSFGVINTHHDQELGSFQTNQFPRGNQATAPASV